LLRVCFISPLGYGLYHPESGVPFGGAEVQTFLTAGALAKDAGFHASVLVTAEREPVVEQLGALTLIIRRGRGRLAERQGLRALGGYWSSFREMWRLFQQINADVYVHAGSGAEVGAYALICRLLHRQFVFVVASNADLDNRYGLTGGSLRQLYPLGVRLADRVVCRTEDQRALLRRRFGRDGLLIRCAHSIPMESDEDRKTILWVGRIHRVKQPLLFLDLADRCPELCFTMVGMRDPLQSDLWDSVQARIRKMQHVAFHSNLPFAGMNELFKSAALVVNTSQYEGFPNTYVQAAAHGVPIVSLSVDPDRVIAEQGLGRCVAGNFEHLVGAVRRLADDDALRADCGRRARLYASEHHSLEAAVSRWKAELLALSGHSRRAPLGEAA
jgi:glycosyltransferase involved in cell wall biosynthesis